MNECIKVKELLIPYINKNLSPSLISLIVTHLAKCEECRKEAAFIIRLSNELDKSLMKVPIDIKINSFEKIKLEKNVDFISVDGMNEDIINMFNKVPSPTVAFDLITYLMMPIKKTIKLTLENV